MNFQDLNKCGPGYWSYDVHDQLKRHIYERSERYFASGESERDAIKTVSAIRKRQKWIRKVFLDSIGGIDFPKSMPLNSRITGTIKCDGFCIEKVIFESRPKTYVTANLYLPDGITTRRGAVLFLCGHKDSAKQSSEYQVVCRHLVKAGLVVLAMDPVGQGERFSYYEPQKKQVTVGCGTSEHDYAGAPAFLLGGCIARYFLHDAMRAIDYLCTRPEVDKERIGVTGNSGGGTQTSMLMMADKRVAATAPGTFIMNRRSYMYSGGAQDAEQIWPGLTAMDWDHEDILLAMAPKPVMILAVKYDFFPIEGTRKTFERCRRLWKICGKPENLKVVEDTSTHKYTVKLAKAAANFFAQHLLNKRISISSEGIGAIDPSLLHCTSKGQIQDEFSDARFIYEENINYLKTIKNKKREVLDSDYKNQALKWLQTQVFKERRQCDTNLRIRCTEKFEDMYVELCVWWSQENIFNNGYVFRNTQFCNKSIPITIAVWDGGTCKIDQYSSLIRSVCLSGRAVMVLDVSAEGALAPNSLLLGTKAKEFQGVIHKLTDDLYWLNDSLAAMRVYDIIRSLDAIKELPNIIADDVHLYTCGRAGVYAQLAAALDNRIVKLKIVDGIENFCSIVNARYYDSYDIHSIIIPGILQYFDLPDVRKWIKNKLV